MLRLSSVAQLAVPLDQLLASYLHVFSTRLFVTRQRVQEAVSFPENRGRAVVPALIGGVMAAFALPAPQGEVTYAVGKVFLLVSLNASFASAPFVQTVIDPAIPELAG